MRPEPVAGAVLGGVTAVLAVPITTKLVGRGPSFMRGLGFCDGPRANVAAWTAAALVTGLYIAFSVSRVDDVGRWVVAFSWLKVLALIAAVAAGIVEEAVFRRWIMDGLARAGRPAWLQLSVSAVAFGCAHASWGMLGGNLGMAMGAAVATTALGAALAGVYLLGGRSLAPCIVAHFLIDAAIEPGLILTALQARHR